MHRRTPVFVALVLASASVAGAQTPDGAAVFQKACASCHAQPAADSRAPTREVLAQSAPEAILTALTSGTIGRMNGTIGRMNGLPVDRSARYATCPPHTAQTMRRCDGGVHSPARRCTAPMIGACAEPVNNDGDGCQSEIEMSPFLTQ
jgi:hypothetical protein